MTGLARLHPDSPPADDIQNAREKAGLTKTEAARLVHTRYRTWQKWETGEHPMDFARWELFLIKSGQLSVPIGDTG